MAVCSKCKEQLSVFKKRDYKGKLYCLDCYNEQLDKEKNEKRKKKDEQDAKNSVLRAYNLKPLDYVQHLIRQWRPRGCSTESQYITHLKNYLDKELSHDDIYVGKESGLESNRLDLVIGIKRPYRDIAIELKVDLDNPSHYDRLKGQIHTYVVNNFKFVIILLIGDPEPKFITELRKYKKEIELHYGSYSRGFYKMEIMKK